MARPGKREQLIDVAMQLFNRHGYHATGVDRIMAEAGISKATLYRHFVSKDELVVAVLEKVDEIARHEMRTFVERASSDPLERLLATFGQLENWLRDCEFKGCPFVAAAGEYAGTGSAVFHQVRLHKRLYFAYFEELARAARIPDPERFAMQLVMLHEGAIAFAQVLGADGVVDAARDAARTLIERSVAGEPEPRLQTKSR